MILVGAYTPKTGYTDDFQPALITPYNTITVELSDGSKLDGPFLGQTCSECLKKLSGDVVAITRGRCVHKDCLAGVIGMAELDDPGADQCRHRRADTSRVRRDPTGGAEK